jgi:hypothetical protein
MPIKSQRLLTMASRTLPESLIRPPLDTEKVFDRFVHEFGGMRVSEVIEGTPSFDNADYLFKRENVLAELKTLKTDFGRTRKFEEKHLELTKKYLSKGRMTFGAIFRASERPSGFVADFVRLFRPPLERILKKANSQIKETRARGLDAAPACPEGKRAGRYPRVREEGSVHPAVAVGALFFSPGEQAYDHAATSFITAFQLGCGAPECSRDSCKSETSLAMRI